MGYNWNLMKYERIDVSRDYDYSQFLRDNFMEEDNYITLNLKLLKEAWKEASKKTKKLCKDTHKEWIKELKRLSKYENKYFDFMEL